MIEARSAESLVRVASRLAICFGWPHGAHGESAVGGVHVYVLAWFNLFAGVLELLDLPQEALQLAQHLRLGAMSLGSTAMLSGGWCYSTVRL